jgi:putative FmdB family regulatory protein
MPIYEYTCSKCNEIFARLQWPGQEEEDILCPQCGSDDVKKILSTFNCSNPADSGSSSGGSYSGFSGGG